MINRLLCSEHLWGTDYEDTARQVYVALMNSSHQEFQQVKGQLRITERDFSDFVAWTPVGFFVQRIYEEFNFSSNKLQAVKFLVIISESYWCYDFCIQMLGKINILQ